MRLDAGQIEIIDDQMAEVLRRKTPAQRLEMAERMWQFAGEMIRSVLRSQHPDWSEQQIQHETARRLSHGAI
jgi:hypothetical protein